MELFLILFVTILAIGTCWMIGERLDQKLGRAPSIAVEQQQKRIRLLLQRGVDFSVHLASKELIAQEEVPRIAYEYFAATAPLALPGVVLPSPEKLQEIILSLLHPEPSPASSSL